MFELFPIDSRVEVNGRPGTVVNRHADGGILVAFDTDGDAPDEEYYTLDDQVETAILPTPTWEGIPLAPATTYEDVIPVDVEKPIADPRLEGDIFRVDEVFQIVGYLMPDFMPTAEGGDVAFKISEAMDMIRGERAQAETPVRHPNSQRFHDILKELGDLHDKKQADYGRGDDPFANVRGSSEWGIPAWVGAMVRATDKVKRLQKAARGGTMANESVVDSFMDLAVYAVIAMVLYEQEQA